MSGHRDRCLPQRSDPESDNGYANAGYKCISDGVRGGVLDLILLKGAKLIHGDWDLVDECVPRNMRYYAMKHAEWALSMIQSDLRHRLARVAGTTYIDKTTTDQQVLRCDEGG